MAVLLDELVEAGRTTAIAAADHLRRQSGRRDLQVDAKATSTDLVTDVDRAGEALVVEMLGRLRPDDGMVGEEGTSIRGRSGVEWIIDPLDGTTNFVYGHPGYSVSVAASLDGELVVGVVADPVNDQLFVARAGGGATCNGVAITCRAEADLSLALVATGFGYAPAERARQALVLSAVLPRVRDIRRMGGAAVDLCSVALGRVDAYYERGLQPWDLAAGTVIAREAGAVVTDFDGRPPSEAGCVAAPPGLHGQLLALLHDTESDDRN